jgi:hypothetical protein
VSKPKKNDESKHVSQEQERSDAAYVGDVVNAQHGAAHPDIANGSGEGASLLSSIEAQRPLMLRRVLCWFFAVEQLGAASPSEVAAALSIPNVEAEICTRILKEAGLLTLDVADVVRYRVSSVGHEALEQLLILAGQAGRSSVVTVDDDGGVGRSEAAAERDAVPASDAPAPVESLDEAFDWAGRVAFTVVTGRLQPEKRHVQAWLDAVYKQVHFGPNAVGHFGSFEANSRFATRLRLLMQGLGNLRLSDPKTGLAGLLYHSKSTGCPVGRFIIRVTDEKGRFHDGKSSVALPVLKISPERK